MNPQTGEQFTMESTTRLPRRRCVRYRLCFRGSLLIACSGREAITSNVRAQWNFNFDRTLLCSEAANQTGRNQLGASDHQLISDFLILSTPAPRPTNPERFGRGNLIEIDHQRSATLLGFVQTHAVRVLPFPGGYRVCSDLPTLRLFSAPSAAPRSSFFNTCISSSSFS